MGWHGTSAWREASGWLATAERDEFAARCLRFLRNKWPTLSESPRLKALDAAGIDLLIWSDDLELPLAIQCKGYRKDEIGADQVRQARESLEAFLASGLHVDQFILVHNRDGRLRMRETLEPILRECVTSGRARSADLWDREQILDNVFDHLGLEIRHAIRAYSNSLAGSLERLFAFQRAQLTSVPVMEQTATFSRDAPASISPAREVRRADLAVTLVKASGLRWTLLTGTFGMGKTTAALSAARRAEAPTVFVPAVAVPAEAFRSGKRADLLTHVNELIGVAANDGDTSEAGRARLASSILGQILRVNGSTVTFILDGLDEHHELATPRGIVRLLNQVADFQGPVVLTTRREHFESMFGSFNQGMAELALRWGKNRRINVYELSTWSVDESLEVIRRAASIADGAVATNLHALASAVRDGTAHSYYGHLLTYPLFLQFILEDVAESGPQPRGRAELITRFVERKLRRDLTRWVPDAGGFRVQIDERLDPEAAMGLAFQALETVSASMIADGVLLEEIDESEVLRIFESVFGHKVEILPVLLNSVLVTRGRRTVHGLKIGFALRVLQEFFAAAHAVRHNIPTDTLPRDVVSLADELRVS